MSQQWYYDFMNPNSALQQALIKNGFLGGLRYIKDFASVKVSMFRYKNIEKIPNLTSEILETALLFFMQLCFYKKEGLGWILCRYIFAGEFNEYIKPVEVNLTALNGASIATGVPYEDIIVVRDNSMDIVPFIPMCEYIQRIEECDNAVFRVLNVASLPLVIAGSKKMATQLKATARAIGSKDAFIFGDDTLVDNIKAFNVDVPINPLDIYKLKERYKNECLSSIGIYNSGVDTGSKERKTVLEVSSNNDYADSIYQDMLRQRLSFIDKLNAVDSSLNIEIEESYWKTIEETAEETRMMAVASDVSDGGGNNA